ncbi:hypothetical protein CHELA41_22846 [Hyphomicrobiales bacterium]|nr:hypothetical protein CHELA41_22846 [Hyphomicrobiales bacterium]
MIHGTTLDQNANGVELSGDADGVMGTLPTLKPWRATASIPYK